MNVENILKVADAIEQHSIPDLGFNMRRWRDRAGASSPDLSGHGCGTVACIGGTAEAMFPKKLAEDALGLTHEQSKALFFAVDGTGNRVISDEEFGSITPSQAAAVLRHLAATGEVDWSITLSTDEGEQK